MKVDVSFVGRANSERLTVSLPHRFKAEVPYHPVEELAGRMRDYLRANPEKPGLTYEHSATVEGFFSDNGQPARRCPVTVWCRCSQSFVMLTFACGESGQLSLPYRSILPLVQRERRNLI